jgi:hypothetical protein
MLGLYEWVLRNPRTILNDQMTQTDAGFKTVMELGILEGDSALEGVLKTRLNQGV